MTDPPVHVRNLPRFLDHFCDHSPTTSAPSSSPLTRHTLIENPSAEAARAQINSSSWQKSSFPSSDQLLHVAGIICPKKMGRMLENNSRYNIFHLRPLTSLTSAFECEWEIEEAFVAKMLHLESIRSTQLLGGGWAWVSRGSPTSWSGKWRRGTLIVLTHDHPLEGGALLCYAGDC